MITIEKKIHQEIMATDVYLCISSDEYSGDKIRSDMDEVVGILRNFEHRFSRFIKGNELEVFNGSEELQVSEDFYKMLSLSKAYYKETEGCFDPSVLPYLIYQGYARSKTEGFVDTELIEEAGYLVGINQIGFDDLILDEQTKTVKKPLDLKIDLGGIGKGYAIEIVASMFSKKYKDFCVSIGGDMYLSGRDVKNDYEYWAIEIEDPFNDQVRMPTLIVSNLSIATSGTYKRSWVVKGMRKHHIIDPRTKRSSESDLVSVTIISDSPVRSDILAKTVLILGLEKGLEYCNNKMVPVIAVDEYKIVHINKYAERYIWKA